MSIAVVFAARQQNGFTLCKELLDRGYTVYANDHSHWQNDQHEEKWLFIGRNANLYYSEIDKDDFIFEEGNNGKKVAVCFIPVIDYYLRSFPEVNKNYIKELESFASDSDKEAIFVFIQPSAVHLDRSSFYLENESIMKEIKKTNEVRQYFIPLPTSDYFFSLSSQSEKMERIHIQKDNLIKTIIQEIEEIYM